MALSERELDTASSGRFDGLLHVVVKLVVFEPATEDRNAVKSAHKVQTEQGRDMDKAREDMGRTRGAGDVTGY